MGYGPSVCTLARRYNAYLDSQVTSLGITSSQVPLLAHLWEGHCGDTQNDIARALGVDKGTVSRTVAALVKMGLVTQDPSARDSRACVIGLTDDGRRLEAPVTEAIRSWSFGVTDGMTDGECNHVLDHLAGMNQRAESLASSAQVGRARAAMLPRGSTVAVSPA
jgi:DNA-binding MarR family transcriptional regulator